MVWYSKMPEPSEVWQLLLGYRPLSVDRRVEAVQRKRQEYRELRSSLYEASPAVVRANSGTVEKPGKGDADGALLVQIRKDLPRTQLRKGGLKHTKSLVEHPRIQTLMERVLFVWAVRQPASGYVQGFNDVLLPFLLVSLESQTGKSLEDLDVDIMSQLGEDQVSDIEADCYWCVTKVLSEIFDHYTHGWPGIERMIKSVEDVLRRVDAALMSHLESQAMDIRQMTFQWIACLMVREMPILCCLRLWDTLIAESATAGSQRGGDNRSPGFEIFLVYFCACFISHFNTQLQAMDFEAIMLFLQDLPTDTFSESDIELLLSEAFVLKSLFQQAPRHLGS